MKRYKRFLADVTLSNGETVTAHCANPGSMLGLKEPGSKVWLSPSNNPKRKLKYSWELIEVDLGLGPALVGINTGLPNKLAIEALEAGTVAELSSYASLRKEVPYGENSRIDILLEQKGSPATYVEIKNVHLMRETGKAEFPDSVTARGTKHLNELSQMVQSGHRAVMLYLVQRSDADSLSFARDIDPAYGAAFDKARQAGIEAYCYKCDISLEGIYVKTALPILEK